MKVGVIQSTYIPWRDRADLVSAWSANATITRYPQQELYARTQGWLQPAATAPAPAGAPGVRAAVRQLVDAVTDRLKR